MSFIDSGARLSGIDEAFQEQLRLAGRAGLTAIIDAPEKPVITEKELVHRIKIAEKARALIKYFPLITLNGENTQEALRIVNDPLSPSAAGFVVNVTTRSGPVGIIKTNDLEKIFHELKKYSGLLCVHAPQAYVPNSSTEDTVGMWLPPDSRRVEEERITSVLHYANKEGFRGQIHFSDIFLPASVEQIWSYDRLIRSCGVSIRTLTQSTEDEAIFEGTQLTPPLLKKEEIEKIKQHLFQGKIACIESGREPLEFGKKKNAQTALMLYPLLPRWMQKIGIADSREQHKILFENPADLLPLRIRLRERRGTQIDYSLSVQYKYTPFSNHKP